MSKCELCDKGKAEHSVTDSETLKEVMICEECNILLFIVSEQNL